jgi:ABC-2 type transport system ATP-binding protein
MRQSTSSAQARPLELEGEPGPAAVPLARTPRPETPAPGLVMRGVSRRYGPRTILSSVDLDVEPGGSVLISGPNGAGKTTLLRVAAGVITPHRGTIRLGGLDPDADRRAYQRRLGLLSPGDRGVYARLTVRQNLEFGARIALIPRRSRQAAIERGIERFGLTELAERRSDRLSMGQRQRIRLALTFLHDPFLVLLDEPSTSLDEAGVGLLAGVVEEQMARGGSVAWCAPTGSHPELPVSSSYVVTDGRLEPT